MQYQQLIRVLLIIHSRLRDCDVLHTYGITMAVVSERCGKDKTQTFPVHLGMGL